MVTGVRLPGMDAQSRYDRLAVNTLRRFAARCREDAITATVKGKHSDSMCMIDLAAFLDYAAHHLDQLVWSDSLFDPKSQ